MIAPRRTRDGIHALLNHGPLALHGHHKRVQIGLKTVLDRRVVDLGGQPAVPDQGVPLQPVLVGDGAELVRRQERMLSPAATNIYPRRTCDSLLLSYCCLLLQRIIIVYNAVQHARVCTIQVIIRQARSPPRAVSTSVHPWLASLAQETASDCRTRGRHPTPDGPHAMGGDCLARCSDDTHSPG